MEVIQPQNEAEWLQKRLDDITSTEVSALFGLNPYITKYELWHHKKNRTIPGFEINERMKWGTRLQDAIAEGIAQDNSWKIRRMSEYLRNSDLRIGASFDYEIIGFGLLEVKNVDGLAFKEGWICDGDYIEAPAHIELQVQHQMLVSRRNMAWIGALVGGNDVKLFQRLPEEEIHDSILKEVKIFWQSIEDGVEPEPEYARDYDFIAKLNKYSEPGKVITVSDAKIIKLTAKYKEYSLVESEAEKERKAIKAELLTLIGDAEKVVMDGYSISSKTIPPTRVEAYEKASYRDFRVYQKKG